MNTRSTEDTAPGAEPSRGPERARGEDGRPPTVPRLLPVRFRDYRHPFAGFARWASVTRGIVLMLLFFAPIFAFEGKLEYLWDSWRALFPSELVGLAEWGFALGLMAFLGGLLASTLPLGIVLAGGVLGTLVFADGAVEQMAARDVVAVAVLMFFLAATHLRGMFRTRAASRVMLSAGTVMLLALCLVYSRQISLRHGFGYLRGYGDVEEMLGDLAPLVAYLPEPRAGLLICCIAAGLLAIVAMALDWRPLVAGCSSTARFLVFLGLFYVPMAYVGAVAVHKRAAPGTASVDVYNEALKLLHAYGRGYFIVSLGAMALALMLGAILARGPRGAARSAGGAGRDTSATVVHAAIPCACGSRVSLAAARPGERIRCLECGNFVTAPARAAPAGAAAAGAIPGQGAARPQRAMGRAAPAIVVIVAVYLVGWIGYMIVHGICS